MRTTALSNNSGPMPQRLTLLWRVLYVLVLIPLLKPDSFDQVHILDVSFHALKILSAIVILFLWFALDRKIDGFIFTSVVFLLLNIVSTFLNDGNMVSVITELVATVAGLFLFKIIFDQDPLFCLELYQTSMEILLYLNLLTVLIFPHGMYIDEYHRWTNWLLGLDNVQAPYYVFAIAVSATKDYWLYEKEKLSFRTKALIAVCLITVAICWQATAVVGMTVLLIYFIFPKLFKSRSINIWTYYLVIAAFFILIVLCRVQEWFSFIIEDLLHKSLTFSSRTVIWDRAMYDISRNPWIGYGVQNREWIWAHLGHGHTHNVILQILWEGGIVQLAFYLVMLFLVAKKLMKNREHPISQFLSLVIFSMLLMNMMEPYAGGWWLSVYLLAYNSDRLIAWQKQGLSLRPRKRFFRFNRQLR